MATQAVHIDVPIIHSRYLPPMSAVETARAAQATGVIDSVCLWDSLTFFAPRALWSPERSPMAAALPDVDSFADPLAMLAYVAAHVPDIGLTATCDAIRRGPTEMTQTMLTVAGTTNARLVVQMGAGEAKNCGPFGHRRRQGVKRLDDHFQIFRKYIDSTEPISHDGHFWTLDRAWIGGERRTRPQLWALGGGPRLIDVATRHGDGFCTIAPFVWARPEQAAERIASIKETLEAHGRDPEAFEFGMWWACLLHDDHAGIEEAMRNDYIRWLALTLGRFHAPDWRAEGIEPPLGDAWHYANDLLPVNYTEAEAIELLARATPEVLDRAWFHGTPEEVADQMKPFIDAGVTWVQILDMVPLTVAPEQAPRAFGRTVELARLIKGYTRTSRAACAGIEQEPSG